jgi:hypothetical protein
MDPFKRVFRLWLMMIPFVLLLNVGFIALVVYIVKLIWSM